MTLAVTPRRLADEFAETLHGCLTAWEWLEMCRRNAAETSRNICHSHDFCDANIIMHVCWLELGLPELDGDSETHTDFWNAAWDLAAKDYFGRPKS